LHIYGRGVSSQPGRLGLTSEWRGTATECRSEKVARTPLEMRQTLIEHSLEAPGSGEFDPPAMRLVRRPVKHRMRC
jgi:hypothetical protein